MKKFTTESADLFRSTEDSLVGSVSEVWDSSNDAIGLLTQPYEAKKIQDVFSSDNKPFDKVMTVFAYLCWEVRELRKIAVQKFFARLSLFGEVPEEDDDDDGELPDSEVHLQVGRLMGTLQDLKNFLKRCNDVGKNLIQQLANVYRADKVRGQVTSFAGVHVSTIFEHLAELCALLISLDEIIDKNENISEFWTRYKKMLKTVGADPERFGTDAETLDRYETYMNMFEDELLDGRIFPTFTDQEFTLPGTVSVASNATFMKEFMDNLSKMQEIVSGLFETGLKTGRRCVKQGREVTGLYGLFILYCRMHRGMPDKKMYKELYMLHRKIPAVVVYGRAMFMPQDLLTSLVPPPPNTIKLVELTGERRAYLASLDERLPTIAEALHLQVSAWLVQLEDSMSKFVTGVELYRSSLRTGDLLIKGVLMAQSTGFLLRTYMNLHLELSVPFRQSLVPPISSMIELLQTIGRSFTRRQGQVALRLTLIVRHVSRYLSDKLAPMRHKLEKNLVDNKGFRSKKQEGSMVDMLSAVRLMMNLLDGCVGEERLVVLNLTWEMFAPRGRDLCSIEVLRSFDEQLWKLGILVQIQTLMTEACDTSFLYYQMQLIPPMLQIFYSDPSKAHRIHSLIASLEDTAMMLGKACHEAPGESPLQDSMKKEVIGYLENELIRPLCTDTETDLRMHIHSSIIVQELRQKNPLQEGCRDLSRFVTGLRIGLAPNLWG